MRHTQEGKFEADKRTERRRSKKKESIFIFLVNRFRNNENITDLMLNAMEN